MIQPPVIAGNWKLHHSPTETKRFIEELLHRLPDSFSGTIALFPPSISLTTAVDALGEGTQILVGVQNVYWEAKGAFTGEISAPLARDAGARLALVGHSERRHIFGETDEDAARKVRATLDAGLLAVLCVGESLEQREAGDAFEVVRRQLTEGLGAIDEDELDRTLIAYEPVWAIGTGRTASPDDASQMHHRIREQMEETFGSTGKAVPILYGGSVKPGNAESLLAAPDVDGLLIGGASLEPGDFATICRLRP